jgi:hypothetical protein
MCLRFGSPGIDEGQLLQLLHLFLQGLARADVRKYLNGADKVSVDAPQRRGPHPHRQAVPLLVMQVNLGLVRCAVGHGSDQRAGPLAKLAADGIHVDENVIGAGCADHFCRGIPGDALSALVPEGDAALAVHEINPVVHVFDDVTIPVFGWHCAAPCKSLQSRINDNMGFHAAQTRSRKEGGEKIDER